METTLHRQLKKIYAKDESQCEVAVDGFRIDAVDADRLIEIQFGSLAAIRDKVRQLLATHKVLVVKPLAARKYLVTHKRKNGEITSSRYSPKRETFFHLFQDLVHFVGVFPHPNLTLEVILTEQEEHRTPARKRRWRSKGYRVDDRSLRDIVDRRQLETASDLLDFLPVKLLGHKKNREFSTQDIAEETGIPRWLAQKLAYCLRKTGATTIVGKNGNSLLYGVCKNQPKAA